MIDYKEQFLASHERLTGGAGGDRFFDRFYERFIAADPGIAERFADTNLDNQKRMLRESFAEMRSFSESMTSNIYIVTLAKIHGVRGLDIPARYFDIWLDELVATVRELDPQVNDNVELAWRLILAPGVTFMKFYRER